MKQRIGWLAVSLLALGLCWLVVAPKDGIDLGTSQDLVIRGSGPQFSDGDSEAPLVPDLGWGPVMFTDRVEPHRVEMSEVPALDQSTQRGAVPRVKSRLRAEIPIPAEKADRLRREALDLPPSSLVQRLEETASPGMNGPVSLDFDGPDMSEACDGCGTVPPDPELAVGPDHVIAVVNVAFAIYDKTGAIQPGYPKYFADFFAGVPGCTNEFDPNVLYDEQLKRYVLGIDGGGTHYCIAASATSDPTGAWNLYSFQTGDAVNFFDYPHAGVGVRAIYMGANIFSNITGGFVEGRVWAIQRRPLYLGQPINVVSRSLGTDSTPQPMNLHGFQQGTWPTSKLHYILTDDQFNGATYGQWSWDFPFNGSGGVLAKDGIVDLVAATGVPAGFPIDAPQQGGANIQANDWRVQDAEYRNGYLWMTNTISCNPGGGTVNCVRWAQIKPSGPAVVQAGVFASEGQHRIFADAAVNHCETLIVGYSKTSTTSNPGVSIAGRLASTPLGQFAGERDVIAGQAVYSAFDSAPRRWGDYSGMTSDPNGVDLWYLGEYSKNINFALGNWGTRVAKVSIHCATP